MKRFHENEWRDSAAKTAAEREADHKKWAAMLSNELSGMCRPIPTKRSIWRRLLDVLRGE